MRAEFTAIETAMAKLAGYTGNGSKFLRVNAAGTAYEALSVADALAALAPSSAALATALTDTTGTGVFVRTQAPTLTSAVLVTPALGTPASGVLTNCTGTAAGLTAGNVTTNANLTGGVTSVGNAATVVTNANLTGHITSVGNAAVLGSFSLAQLNTAVNDADVLSSGGALGTPSSGNLANCTFPTLNQNTTGSSASCTGNTATATTATTATNTGGKTTIASATTPDIFATSVGTIIDYTGTATCTGFVAAPQAGATKRLICAGACLFTAGANLLIEGITSGTTITLAANAIVDVTAITTTQFKMTYSVSGSFTATGTGFTVNPTTTALYKVENGKVDLHFQPLVFTGTSNATTFTITGLPAVVQPVGGSSKILPVMNGLNNSANVYVLAHLTGGSGTIELSNGINNGSPVAWTASGTKVFCTSDLSYLVMAT